MPPPNFEPAPPGNPPPQVFLGVFRTGFLADFLHRIPDAFLRRDFPERFPRLFRPFSRLDFWAYFFIPGRISL